MIYLPMEANIFMSMYDHLLKSTKGKSKNIAVENNYELISYDQLIKKIDLIAEKLVDFNLTSDNHVGIVGKNSLNYITTYFALSKIKVKIMPLSQSLTKSELHRVTNDADLNYIIYTGEVGLSQLHIDSLHGTHLTEEIFIEKVDSFNRYKCEFSDLSLLLLTSGTTSNPKIVMHSSDNVIQNALNHSKAVGYENDERSLVLLPFTHSFAHTCQMLAILYTGGTLVIKPNTLGINFNLINFLTKNKISSTLMNHTYLKMIHQEMMRYPSEKLPFLKHVCFAGSPIPAYLPKDLSRNFTGTKFLRAYGLTEAGPRVTVASPSEKDSLFLSSGKAVENTSVEIVNYKQVGQKKIGEIIVRSKTLMLGYYKNERLTSETLKEKKLFTGDIGYVDDNKNLHVTGRIKNMVIISGINVQPEEVEEYLSNHPLVDDVLVYGENDDLSGEVLIADVVLIKEFEDLDGLKKELIEFCKKGLSGIKIPQDIIFKKNIINKLNRKG